MGPVVDVAVMAGIIGPLALLVGVTLLLAAGSMWSRRLRDTGETVQGTVTDAEVVDSDAMNADHAVALAYRYRYDGTTHEGHDGVHPTTWDESDTPTGSADAPAVPSEYREGDVVSVTVEDVGSEGDGVAKVEEFTVFVDGAEMDEELDVEITEVKPKFAFAEPVEDT